MLAACGGGDSEPQPQAQPAPSPAPAPAAVPAPSPAPGPAPLPVVGAGPASDCFNPTNFLPMFTTSADYRESDPVLGYVTVNIVGIGGQGVFNGQPISTVSEFRPTGTMSAVGVTTTRFVQVEGNDLVLIGRSMTSVANGVRLSETVETYGQPFPRDKSFTLSPGGTYVTHYTVVTSQTGTTTTTTASYTITSNYLGQEQLTVLGVTYPTCKFQFIDSRTPDAPTVTWFAKGPANIVGFVVRSEVRNGSTLFVRELVRGSSGVFTAP